MKKGIVFLLMMAVAVCAAAKTTKEFTISISDVKEAEQTYTSEGICYKFSGVNITPTIGAGFGIYSDVMDGGDEYMELHSDSNYGNSVIFSLDEEYADWKIQEIIFHLSVFVSSYSSYLTDASISAGWYEERGEIHWNGASPQKSVSCWGMITIRYIEVIIEKNEYLTVDDTDYVLNRVDDEYSVVEESLIFPDRSDYSLNYNAEVKNLTYTRSFGATVGVWQAWCVPFDVDVEALDEQGFEVAEIAGIVINGSEPYVGFVKLTEGTMRGNVPYVVKASEPNLCLELENVKMLSSNDLWELTIQSAYDDFTFTPVMKTVSGKGMYALNTKGEFQLMGDIPFYPQRFVLAVEQRTDTPYYKSDVNVNGYKITVMGEDTDDVTGIGEIQPGACAAGIYDLKGLRVGSGYKGIVIKNGKKYLAK